jgi:hypothetical protein
MSLWKIILSASLLVFNSLQLVTSAAFAIPKPITLIAKIATYGGACLAVMCVFKYTMALREEDAKARHEAIKLLLVAIALLSFKSVLKIMHVL